VHAFVNDLERRVGTYLYGRRRLYQVMVAWENMPTLADQPPVVQESAPACCKFQLTAPE
jgi:hypothetical protein